jgi:uncharacterized membrane protein YeiH
VSAVFSCVIAALPMCPDDEGGVSRDVLVTYVEELLTSSCPSVCHVGVGGTCMRTALGNTVRALIVTGTSQCHILYRYAARHRHLTVPHTLQVRSTSQAPHSATKDSKY